MSYCDYMSGEPLSYWRSTSGFEVDFIIGDHTAVDVKAKENVSAQDVRSLKALAEEKCLKRWNRAWKIKLIEENNPHWDDLYNNVFT